MSDLYNLDAARSEEQREYMRGLQQAGICVFCEEHVGEHQRQGVQWRGEHWYVTRNDFPYEGAIEHYLIVSRRHVASFQELSEEAGAELWAIRRRLAEQIGAVAYATIERSGDMRFNGGSVEHLHVHLLGLEEQPSQTVRFRVSARGADERSP